MQQSISLSVGRDNRVDHLSELGPRLQNRRLGRHVRDKNPPNKTKRLQEHMVALKALVQIRHECAEIAGIDVHFFYASKGFGGDQNAPEKVGQNFAGAAREAVVASVGAI